MRTTTQENVPRLQVKLVKQEGRGAKTERPNGEYGRFINVNVMPKIVGVNVITRQVREPCAYQMQRTCQQCAAANLLEPLVCFFEWLVSHFVGLQLGPFLLGISFRSSIPFLLV